jgi:hypothetical protein
MEGSSPYAVTLEAEGKESCLIWTSLLCGFNISIIKILSSLNTTIYFDVIKRKNNYIFRHVAIFRLNPLVLREKKCFLQRPVNLQWLGGGDESYLLLQYQFMGCGQRYKIFGQSWIKPFIVRIPWPNFRVGWRSILRCLSCQSGLNEIHVFCFMPHISHSHNSYASFCFSILNYNAIESVDGWAFNGSEIAKL